MSEYGIPELMEEYDDMQQKYGPFWMEKLAKENEKKKVFGRNSKS